MASFLEGLFLQAGMIASLGAQNLYMIDTAAKRSRFVALGLLFSTLDFLLIFLGITSAPQLIAWFPPLRPLLTITGAILLFVMAVSRFRAAPAGELASPQANWVAGALGVTLLNPHVYLDTVFIIGGRAAQFSLAGEKVSFGLGAGVFSLLWFMALGLGAVSLGHHLTDRRSLRVFNILSGVLLTVLSLRMFYGAFL